MAAPDSLQKLVEDGVIDEIQQRLMSGKEASVYIVSYRGEVVAAKVYKARDRRSFKATSSYTEGRNQTRNSRDRRAMAPAKPSISTIGAVTVISTITVTK